MPAKLSLVGVLAASSPISTTISGPGVNIVGRGVVGVDSSIRGGASATVNVVLTAWNSDIVSQVGATVHRIYTHTADDNSPAGI